MMGQSGKRAFCMLFLMLLLVLSGCGKEDSWQEQYDLGVRYLTECNYEEAIIAFTSAMKENPQNTNTYIYLAQVYLAYGDPETAEQILTQGYNATDDPRLNCSNVDGWFLYNPSLAFDRQLAYRDFSLLSTDQQTSLRQAVAAAKQGDRETAANDLKESNLPIQLFTELDGEQIEVTNLPETENEMLLKAYNDQLQQELEETEEDSESGQLQIDKIGQYQLLIVRPENGIEYRCGRVEFTYELSMEGQTFPMTIYMEAYGTTDCVDGQYNGNWSNEGYFWFNKEYPDDYTCVESSGHAAAGEKFEDGPQIMKQVSGKMVTVTESQGDQLTAYYIENQETGERVDLLHITDWIGDIQDQLGV